MDITQRKITKIAREAEKLVLLTVREEGVGTAEIDLIHALRHHPGCTQAHHPACPRPASVIKPARGRNKRGLASAQNCAIIVAPTTM